MMDNVLVQVLIQGIMSGFSCLFFAVVYHTPKSDLKYIWILGAVGYALQWYMSRILMFGAFASFCGSLAIVIPARFIALKLNKPIMLYILPAIYPLAPGANLCKSGLALTQGDFPAAGGQLLIAIRVVGACVLAILFVMSVPERYFYGPDRKKH